MKKLILITLMFAACSEDNDPVFRIEDSHLEDRFENFVEIADNLGVTVPKNNMVLRYVTPNQDQINDSRVYMEEDQLYIDIDKSFVNLYSSYPGGDKYVNVLIYQQLANGLLGTPFSCGIMTKVVKPEDMPEFKSLDYAHYPGLFDANAPC